jgi:hypothetical protein
MRRLATFNLVLVAVQPVSAGFLMSGFEYALAVQTDVAIALELSVLTQAIAGVILWRRGRLPGATAAVSVALFVALFLQVGFGHTRRYWLHVPIGVGIIAWVSRQVNQMGAFRSATVEADRIA